MTYTLSFINNRDRVIVQRFDTKEERDQAALMHQYHGMRDIKLEDVEDDCKI